MPAMSVVSFGAGLVAPDLIRGSVMCTLLVNSSGSPVWAAKLMTGTSPAHDTRWSSSKTAADTAKLWDTLTGSAFPSCADECVESTHHRSSEGTFLVATADDQPIHRWIEAKGRRR
jgi:hypothetical protein